MPHSILVVEDDQEVNQLLTARLREQGFVVQSNSDGERALATVRANHFDLVILDVMLPKLNGLEVLTQLRRDNIQPPVLLLTALGAEQDRIDGFKSGADDYLTKPFNTEELLLRVEVILRRSQTANQLFSSTHQSILAQLDLTPVEQQVMNTFLLHLGETLSKPFLYREALSKSFRRYDRTLDMHVSHIRKKMAELGQCSLRIKTIHGQGYQMYHV